MTGIADGHWNSLPLLTITARGKPSPQGSKKPFRNQHTGRIQMVESSKALPGWRDVVRAAAWDAIRCCPDPDCPHMRPGHPLDAPLIAAATFTMHKPDSAPKTRQTWPSGRPDASKLVRAVEDSLTDVGVYKDDARIVEYVRLAKVYPGEGFDALPVPGVVFRIWLLEAQAPIRRRITEQMQLIGATP